MRAIVLSSFVDDDKLFPAVRAGAAGYLLKDVQPQELVEAIRTVHGGGALLHPQVAARLLEEHGRGPADAARARGAGADRPRDAEQADRARAVAVGEDRQGARVLILAKLGVTDRTQAALYAVREGLVGPGS